MKLRSFLDRLAHESIVAAIGEAERRSRGEIRVHVSGAHVRDAQQAARSQFERLGMAATRERNGVLIFVAPLSQSFAVVGDEAIHSACGASFWNEVATAMETAFRQGRFSDGILDGIGRVADALALHFPADGTIADRNELPDQVSED
jgi:uncharacterized membrane protein